MSDTPNMAKTASKLADEGEFDARLLRTDEPRWLATRYAPAAGRRALVAIYLLHQELQRALQVREPMMAKIRIQWWRETLEGFGAGSVRRHDLSQELALATEGRPDLVAGLLALVDRYDDVADDHLHDGGHDSGGAHAARHMAAESALVEVAARALGSLDDRERTALRLVAEAHLARLAGLADASARWNSARTAARTLRAQVWPAIAHLAVKAEDSPLRQRWSVFCAVLRRQLPATGDPH